MLLTGRIVMPASARQEIVLAGEVGVYHIWTRCVRRAFLCGVDPVTGQNFDHRRDWIRGPSICVGSFRAGRSCRSERLHVNLARYQIFKPTPG
jgi:hypothetical protein